MNMKRSNKSNFEYDFVISYASEDTNYAEILNKKLSNNGAKVFFAPSRQTEMWGENLYEYLSDIYSNRGRFCIPIISTNYVRKHWTRHEWRSAQTRALKQIDSVYILPIKIDEIELPGLLETTMYLSIDIGIDTIVDIACEKLRISKDDNLSQNQPYSRGGFNLFFDQRLEIVLDGNYGLRKFSEPRKIDKVLHTIFQMPLIYIYNGKRIWQYPIWWFRGFACNDVRNFRKLGGNQYLIGYDEFVVREVYVYRNKDELDMSFLYVDCDPLPLTFLKKEELSDLLQGVHTDTRYSLKEPFVEETLAYSSESDIYIPLGRHSDQMIITSWMLNELGADELRRRYVTKYNRFFASNESRMNSNQEGVHKKLCNALLNKDISMEDFLDIFLQFPHNPMWDY